MIKRGWRVLSAVLIAVLLGVWLFTAARHSVYGYTSQTVRKDTAYKDGYFYVVLQDMGGQMTRCRINMSRSASVKYDDFKSRGQSYSCSLVVETGNHHNVRLDSTAFTTTASNANGRYTIGIRSTPITAFPHGRVSGRPADGSVRTGRELMAVTGI